MVALVVDDTTTIGDAIAIVYDALVLVFVRGGGSGKVGLVLRLYLERYINQIYSLLPF